MNALLRALRSFGQGASNAVASNVSVPVDAIAWALRKGGLPIPQNPVGGSDWMAQQGLTATPQNRIAGLLGETAGMVGPAVVQAAAPKIAGGLLALDDKAMDMARQGIERRMDVSGMRLSAAPQGAGRGFVYPQQAALETAQRNAAKPISEGGLGLPKNNTPADRAAAMGFDMPAAHFSRHGADVQSLDSGKFAIAPFDAVGTHVGPEMQALDRFKNTVGFKVGNPDYANDVIKASTYPVQVRRGSEMLTPDGKPYSETSLSMMFSKDADYGNLRESNAALRNKIFGQKDSIPYVNDVESPGQISYILPPKNIRSRFAAFDPMRRDSPDLLAGALPFTVMADEDSRNELLEMLRSNGVPIK